MKISCVIPCKGRLHHLQQTMPLNLANSPTEVEFSVVDYDCPDGTASWLFDTYPKEIKSGRIMVIRVANAPFFYNCHAANIGFLHSSGDLICKLDADNYVKKGFIEFMCNKVGEGAIATPGAKLWGCKKNPPSGTFGRLVIWRDHFLEIGGYNEDFVDYAWDDVEIAERSIRNGSNRISIPRKFLRGMVRHDASAKATFLENKGGRGLKKIWKDQREIRNKAATDGLLVANVDREWGKAIVSQTFRK